MAEDRVWKIVPGFQAYEVSEDGEVRRRFANPHKPHFYPAGSRVWPTVGGAGYLRVTLKSDSGKSRLLSVHRVVALSFPGNPPPGREIVAHNDGTKRNNHYSNLRWATPAENSADRDRHGRGMLGKSMPTCQGTKHRRAKLTEAQVKAMRHQRASGWSLAEIKALYRGVVAAHTVESILYGRTWRHLL